MKANIFKYVFFIILITLTILGIYILYKDGNVKSIAAEQNKMQINMAQEINIGILGFDTINPILSSNMDIQYISKLIFEPLLDITKDFKIENKLAKEFSKINDKTYIVKLKEDILWHNKTKLTAKDVIFTINNLKKDSINSIYKENVRNIEKIEEIDEYTIKIILSKEESFFEYKMCIPILSSDLYEENTLNCKTEKQIGTGKYKIEKQKDDIIELTLAEENSKSNIKKINIILKEKTKDLYNSFLKGELDYIITNNIDYENYLGTMGYNVCKIQGREYEYLVLNTKKNILSDKEIRKAIDLMIDRNNINYNVYNSKYKICNYPLDYGSFLYNNSIKDNYNISLAKNILIENGWEYKNKIWKNKNKKLQFNLVVNKENEKRVALAKQIKEQLAKEGIVINISQVNNNSYNNYLKNKNYDMILTGNIISNSPNLETYFGENNISNFYNEEIKTILNDVREIKQEEMLKNKYLDIEKIYNDEIPFISMFSNNIFILSNKNLKGDLSCNWYNLFYNIDSWYKVQN